MTQSNNTDVRRYFNIICGHSFNLRHLCAVNLYSTTNSPPHKTSVRELAHISL